MQVKLTKLLSINSISEILKGNHISFTMVLEGSATCCESWGPLSLWHRFTKGETACRPTALFKAEGSARMAGKLTQRTCFLK